jgi:hypothetical protein
MVSEHSVPLRIDWQELHDQKLTILHLFDRVSKEEAEHLEGILCLFDHIQDTCEGEGADVVWINEADRSLLGDFKKVLGCGKGEGAG